MKKSDGKKAEVGQVMKAVKKSLKDYSKQIEQSVPYLLMDDKDDEQIMAEIQNIGSTVADKWVYVFTNSDGKQVTGLSWVGTKNAAYYMRRKKIVNVSIEDIKYEKDPTDPDYMLFTAKVKDLITGAITIGTKRQAIYTVVKGNQLDKGRKDPFWFEKGSSKAKRNAIQDLMPSDKLAHWISKWIKEGKVNLISAPKNADTISDAETEKMMPYIQLISTATKVEQLKKMEAEIIKKPLAEMSGKEKFYIRKAISTRIYQLNQNK